MSSAVKTMQLQMERLQEEMSNTLNTEKIRKTRAQERSILAKPNMEFMKGLLDKSSTLREYYAAEDPTTHWLHEYYPRPCSPAQRQRLSYMSARKNEIISEKRNINNTIDEEKKFEWEGVRKNAALTEELKEITDHLQEQEQDDHDEQEYKNITTLPGRMPPQPLLGIAPVETDTKFLESVYNMFHIQSKQIKTLEAEIQELKKDK